MLPKRWLDKMSQEELYQAFMQITERIENDTLAQFQKDDSAVVPFAEYLPEAIELMTDPEKLHGIASGYKVLDDYIKGFEPGELIVVGAETGVGKSMFVQNIFHNMGVRGIPNLFISMEMPNTEAEKRYVEMQMDWAKVKKDKAAEMIKELPLYAYKADNMDLQKLDEKIGEAIEKYGIKILGIDHLHYFTRSQENASGEIGYLVRQFKMMANKHKIPIFLISHLTKLKKKGMPDKSALRDSSFIAQDADAVIMLNRDYMNTDKLKRSQLDFSVQKNRTRGFLGDGRLRISQRYKISEDI